MHKVLTFIMAGGKGERLYPLTKDRTKSAVPFGGIYRIIDFTLSNCINSGLRRIYILTQYKSASLHRHIRLGWNILPSELGQFIELLPAQQRVGDSWYLGTADAIYQNLYTLEMDSPDEVLILAGDHIYKMNYYNMIDFHRANDADLTIGVVEVDKENFGQLGVVEVDSLNRVTNFQEKPKSPKAISGNPDKLCASMGIYVFKHSVIEEELHKDTQRPGSNHDFGKDIIPQMLKEGKRVVAYNFIDENKHEAQYWRDIGTIDAYYETNMDLIQVNPTFNLYDKEWPIRTYQEQFPPVKTVHSGEEIAGRIGLVLDSIVSSACVISGGKVQRSILSPNVRVNSFSEVYDSILMEGVNVCRYAKIKKAIIDKDVNIPQGMVIGYDLNEDKKKFFVTESGIVVVAKGTEIK
ncbi:MAG: glucose-1-phosphate adenylyltransferase [Candidatus Omnitrophica bacterium CG08_land_8_20_14_0_20_41_16]|uniref:Glucose-1-phosphate adenylyltransferase n=1 Tax=Candidatus Sherwoodlollariibacterium unditelluris TaxID=1974757 RepID=A0A2G9YKV1_9BACT|nr:MAG: glucose-1-phosphate adenylyltransferase [Candidatus Omnitrophica bacterium CG23_combo_of_CG06-09_8_20_14_all_41_10]PIS34158.1 MAG: glucose-1-phosphate adenylyltransferase [Candidatus Omnitrophica bacterium CG08_land_8_20_14_0_20_41_16]